MDAWVFYAWGMILMRIGMTLHQIGSMRAKNSVSAAIRAAADICVVTIAFWAVGGAIFYGGKPGRVFAIDTSLIAGTAGSGPILIGLAATLLATGIVIGALGERAKLLPTLAVSLLLSALVVPLAAYWARSGWLAKLGFHDLAGASFLHMVGAIFAFVGAIFVGPRVGKYNRDGSANAIPGHSVPLAALGILLMLACTVPYLAAFHGGFGGPAALNGLVSAAAAGLTAMSISHLRYGKPDIHLSLGGLLGGIIAATAGADVVPGWAALLTGAVAGVIVPMFMIAIDLLWHIDDPTGAVAIHGVGGAWSVLAAGIFGSSAIGRLKLIGAQALGLLSVSIFAVVLSLLLFTALKLFLRLRVREEDEFDGLDLAEHDIAAYPDFQQTMIKSYHLREA